MKYLFIGILRVYKRFISPLLPDACRFRPTCSEYAIQAFQRYGVIRGMLLTGWRLLRCNPLCRGGYDPVPDTFRFTPWRKA